MTPEVVPTNRNGLEIVDPTADHRVAAVWGEACNKSCHASIRAIRSAKAFREKGIPFGPLYGAKKKYRGIAGTTTVGHKDITFAFQLLDTEDAHASGMI